MASQSSRVRTGASEGEKEGDATNRIDASLQKVLRSCG